MERDLGQRDVGKGFSLSDQFGRVDPFCLVIVLPMLLVGVVSLVAGVYIVVTAMTVGAIFIVGFDSWANRPWKLPRTGSAQRTASRSSSRGGDFWDESDHTGTHNRPNQSGQRSRPGRGTGGRGRAPERNARAQAADRAPQSGRQGGTPAGHGHPQRAAERSWPRVP